MDGAATDCSTPGPRRASRTAGDPAVLTHGHGAAVVGTQDEMLAAALPFLDAGLRAGDLVALTCPPETVALLARELGERAHAVESDPRMSLLGSRAPDALTMCRRYLERAAAGETGVRSAARRRRGRFRQRPRRLARGSAVRVGLQPAAGRGPVSAICLYDRRRLPAAVVDSASRHPSAPGPRHHLVAERRLPGPGRLRPLPAAAPRPGRGRRSGLRGRERPHAGRPAAPARRRPRDARHRPRPAGGPPPGRQRDRGERLPARRPAGLGAGLGRRATASSASSATGAPPTATRSAASRPPTASISPSAAWACGWPASSGTTSTCCPPARGCRSD